MRTISMALGVGLIALGCDTMGGEMNEWYYKCGSGTATQSMVWKFKTGDPVGIYELESGSVFKPVDPKKAKDLFVRQDGQEFLRSGEASKWVFTKPGDQTGLTCVRVVDANS